MKSSSNAHLVFAALMFVGGPALAQDNEARDADGARKAEARARLDAGNTLLREKQYEGALSEYEAAFRAYPSPKIRLNIAEAHFQLGNWAAAYNNYNDFLAETEPSSELHGPAESRKNELEAKIAFIQVESPMDEVAVFIDGVHAGDTPIERVAVNPGRHTIVAESDGHERFETAEILSSAESKTVLITLVPLKASPPVALGATTTRDEDDESVLEKWWFWAIVGGAVVAGAGIAIAASTGGSDFLPAGELGASGTSSWERF